MNNKERRLIMESVFEGKENPRPETWSLTPCYCICECPDEMYEWIWIMPYPDMAPINP